MAKKPTPTKKADAPQKAPAKSAPSQPWAASAKGDAKPAPETPPAPKAPAPAVSEQNPPVSDENNAPDYNPTPVLDDQGFIPDDDGQDVPEEVLAYQKMLESLNDDEKEQFEKEVTAAGEKILKRIIQLRVANSYTANMVDGNQHFGSKVARKQ